MTKTIAVLLSLCILCMGGGCSKPPKEVFVDRVVEVQSKSAEEHLREIQEYESKLTVYNELESKYNKLMDTNNELNNKYNKSNNYNSTWHWKWQHNLISSGIVIVTSLITTFYIYHKCYKPLENDLNDTDKNLTITHTILFDNFRNTWITKAELARVQNPNTPIISKEHPYYPFNTAVEKLRFLKTPDNKYFEQAKFIGKPYPPIENDLKEIYEFNINYKFI